VTTTFYLLRHAAHDNVGGFLAGRMPGVTLGGAGKAQARRLADRMRGEPIVAVHSSPQERTRETAQLLAESKGFEQVAIEPALDEIDYGEAWEGRDFATLHTDPGWQRWNTIRSWCRTPGGERMIDVQSRAISLLEDLSAVHRGKSIALVSHADVIKSVVAHVLGLPIDAWPRFEIAPASITTVATGEWGAKLLGMNEVVG